MTMATGRSWLGWGWKGRRDGGDGTGGGDTIKMRSVTLWALVRGDGRSCEAGMMVCGAVTRPVRTDGAGALLMGRDGVGDEATSE